MPRADPFFNYNMRSFSTNPSSGPIFQERILFFNYDPRSCRTKLSYSSGPIFQERIIFFNYDLKERILFFNSNPTTQALTSSKNHNQVQTLPISFNSTILNLQETEVLSPMT
uniref:Uncharacterized protein n=1 Tax=Cacopsylla melanoneura TaxID=428564 RepID=A0A8D8Q4Q9_9HEMI